MTVSSQAVFRVCLLFYRLEQVEEVVSHKLETAEGRIVELEEKLKESLTNEKSMRLQLADVEYSEVNISLNYVFLRWFSSNSSWFKLVL